MGKHHTYDAKQFVDGWLAASEEKDERLSVLQLGLFVLALGREVQRRISGVREKHYAS